MMTGAGRRGDPHSAAPLSVVLPILGALAFPACHASPPKIVPPPPSSPRLLQLQRSIDTVLAAPALARGTWGIVVKSLVSDETLYALNVHKLLMPASTQKVVTLAVAADQLGWDYVFRTPLLIGGIQNGVTGDLIVVGTGDPTLDDWDGMASSRFAEWASALKTAGVRSIDGRIVGDDNAFDDDGLGPGWAWDDLAASFATSVGALQFNQNTAQLIVAPGAQGEKPQVDVRPQSAHLAILNRATTSPTGPPLTVRPVPHTSTIEVDGTIAPTTERIVRNVSVPNPTLYFVDSLRDALIQNGIAVNGAAVDIDDLDRPIERANVGTLVEIQSRPLSAVAETMMKMSQNLYAESLLKTLGAHASTVGSTSAGRAVLDATLAKWGVPSGEVLTVDGSGLSRYNLMTADALAAVLRHVYEDNRLRDPFIGTLPRAGVDGTLGERMKGTAAADNVRAKTGSFTNARSVAGYVRTADGEMLEFVVMANNYGVPAAVIDNATDAIIVSLADFSRR